jgi:hypothetical protein
MKSLRASYNKITDSIVELQAKAKSKRIKIPFTGDELITDKTEYALMRHYTNLMQEEEMQFDDLGESLALFPIWTEFLSKIRGIGPAMGGVIVSEIDIHEAKYPSSLWKYAGLDVVAVEKDGQTVYEGRSRRKDHLVKRTYINREGVEAERDSITFTPFLKTKLVGVLATSFLRSKNPEYTKIYLDYKNRLDNHPAHKDKMKAHKHRMALRYMMKRFLVDLYNAWRPLEGLPVAPEYSEAKLGMIHHGGAVPLSNEDRG